jgi:hypothetical protein
MKKKNTILWIGIPVILALFIGVIYWQRNAPGPHDAFAQCIADSGATFYGAFWCPHCERQLNEFGQSARLLPYVECSTPDGQGQKRVCKEAGIESYPTWDFPDGSRGNGVMSWRRLAEETGCALEE